ncbi:Gfo/Idh/MocA family protein [Paenibacillus allorhizosphaerae]|uniref:Scyllo-inositol 2-dehydrogenase (NAD(+)) n=1 Tax=Paenibacillus allorhizosphaerae TaxID=2849866 RepID=A0ABM8VSR5_9BACL|nr:Gfo/Idh/MocA family oxidoreductase [Paenibacillus allorhizosphaerae]CAG7656876.1 scyllo-inositol 2-dehydrogenase (NAD(+)) [Paenibacillus allorhizosphaerae]
MNKVRIGFIGAGGMAEHHIKTLQKLEQAELTAVHDANPDRAKQIGEQYRLQVYDSAEHLLHSGTIDAVFICTPPFARDGIEESAARKGIHLLSEKPVGLDLEAARSKSRMIKESGIIHSSGYCLRYLESVQKAKAYLTGKSVDMVLAYRIGSLPPTPWFRQMDKSGGQLVEQSTHQVDLIRYLVGEFREVHARYEQRNILKEYPDATIPDVGIISFSLQSGAVGSFSTACMSKKFGRGDVELIGSDFYVAIRGASLRIVDNNQELDEKLSAEYSLEQNRAFIEAVRTGRQELVLCGYDEAVATLEVTLAANESANTGRTITFEADPARK